VNGRRTRDPVPGVDLERVAAPLRKAPGEANPVVLANPTDQAIEGA
jgi:hypothetical protein